MRNRTTIFLSILALSLGCVATWTSGTNAADGEMVDYPTGSGTAKGYLAKPEGDGPFPAILVIQEWWGLADWIKENADRLAGQGYVALAVDLYDGKVTDDRDVAHELSRALDPREAVANMKGAIEYLKGRDDVDQDGKIGAIGWCMGGMYARLIAQESDDIGPTAICYGSVTTDNEQVAELAADGRPILGIFGAEDRGIPVDRVQQFAKALAQAGAEVDLHIYEGAGHGFKRPGGGQYHEAAANDAWEKVNAFFDRHLKRGS